MQNKSDCSGILLDTHIWIWLMEGDERLKESFVEHILVSFSLFVSAISVWELAMLASKDRIHLSMDCSAWVKRSLQRPELSLVSLEPNISIQSTCLPGNFHGDPVDRILVATARHKGLSLWTADQKIINYAQEGFLEIVSMQI